jgi:hypothetical protein
VPWFSLPRLLKERVSPLGLAIFGEGFDGAAVTDLPLISDMRDFMPALETPLGRAVL